MKKKLHIGYIVSHYPHAAFGNDGGLGTSVYNLAESIRTKDIEVTVFVYGQNEEFAVRETNLTLYSIRDSEKRFLKFYFYRKQLEAFINEKISSEKIDIIEAPDWTGITAFMTLKAPLVIRFHGSDAYFCHLEGRKQKAKNFLFEKLALRKAKAFIAPTAFAGELSGKLFGIGREKIKTIHYGLDLHKFENPDPGSYDKGLIVYIGTIIRKKGVLELPLIFSRVIQKCPDARLVLVGGDAADIKTRSRSTWQLVKELMKDNPGHITNAGRIPYSQVQDYIRRANVCVFPTFAETLGMVTIESMALKKPVVNSNIGWANELIVDGESGFLVHPANHSLFADRIIQLLNDDHLVEEMGAKARKRAEDKFDINKKAEENIAFYKSIIAKV